MNDMTRRRIEEAAQYLLRDAGFREPPVCLPPLLKCLELDREFYDLSDPTFIRKIAHKLKIGKHRIIDVLKNKAKLQAVLLFGDSRILIDATLPDNRQI